MSEKELQERDEKGGTEASKSLSDRILDESNNREYLLFAYKNLNSELSEQETPTSEKGQQVSLAHLLLQSGIQQKFPQPEQKDKFLRQLFRFSAARSIETIQKCLMSELMQQIFEILASGQYTTLQGVYDEIKQRRSEELAADVKKMFAALHNLKALAIENIPSDTSARTLPFPFNEVDVSSEPWRKLLNISENFGHSLNKLFRLEANFEYFLNGALGLSQQEPLLEVSHLQIQAKALPAFLRLLNCHLSELTNECKFESIKNCDFLNDIPHALNSWYGEDTELPIKVEIEGEILIENADSDKLFRAIFEIVKGAFASWKIPKEKLAEFDKEKNPYLRIKAGKYHDEATGRDMILIGIVDKGEPIPVDKVCIAAGHTINSWVGVTKALCSRGLTVSSEHEGHKGIGLNSALKIVKEHRGDMYCRNMEEGGVGFLVALPPNRKKTEESLSLDGGAYDEIKNGVIEDVKVLYIIEPEQIDPVDQESELKQEPDQDAQPGSYQPPEYDEMTIDTD